MWLSDTDGISHVEILGVGKDTTLVSGHYVNAVAVFTKFAQEGGDGSFGDGVQPWDYKMIRDPASGRWLINDEGLG
ncbi:hypothetical protein ACIBHX_20835 [Nonomuraea sp. NPDC050536]|uniref:hypothetical protein n=1 Tax=Nonomuraea sp. NPDC050536 TaxID=3364366 RepID=UPI0037CAFE10